MRQEIIPEGLFTDSKGTFKSKEEIQIENLSKPILQYDIRTGLSATEWFEEAQRRQEVREQSEDEGNYLKIELQRDRPAFVGITSDWHLGQKINIPMLQRDVDIMANHPLVVGSFFLGDLTDSANFNPAQDEDMFNFEEQRKWMYKILDDIGKDRILALWKGNHDHKWESKGGTSKYAGLSAKYECPVFYGNSFVEFQINEFVLNMVGSHQLRGSSIYNNAHPIVRTHREINNLDAAFCGHTHRKGKIEQPQRDFNRARVIGGVVCGTYQVSSGYGKDKGWGKAYDPEQGMWWAKIAHDCKDIQYFTTEQMLKEANLYM